MFEVFGFNAGLGNRLKWPDNYFVLYNSLSWQTYKLTNWYKSYFAFTDGISHNLSYTLSLSRNSPTNRSTRARVPSSRPPCRSRLHTPCSASTLTRTGRRSR